MPSPEAYNASSCESDTFASLSAPVSIEGDSVRGERVYKSENLFRCELLPFRSTGLFGREIGRKSGVGRGRDVFECINKAGGGLSLSTKAILLTLQTHKLNLVRNLTVFLVKGLDKKTCSLPLYNLNPNTRTEMFEKAAAITPHSTKSWISDRALPTHKTQIWCPVSVHEPCTVGSSESVIDDGMLDVEDCGG